MNAPTRCTVLFIIIRFIKKFRSFRCTLHSYYRFGNCYIVFRNLHQVCKIYGHLARTEEVMLGYVLVLGYCDLRGTDNVQGLKYTSILLKSNGGYCMYNLHIFFPAGGIFWKLWNSNITWIFPSIKCRIFSNENQVLFDWL